MDYIITAAMRLNPFGVFENTDVSDCLYHCNPFVAYDHLSLCVPRHHDASCCCRVRWCLGLWCTPLSSTKGWRTRSGRLPSAGVWRSPQYSACLVSPLSSSYARPAPLSRLVHKLLTLHKPLYHWYYLYGASTQFSLHGQWQSVDFRKDK